MSNLAITPEDCCGASLRTHHPGHEPSFLTGCFALVRSDSVGSGEPFGQDDVCVPDRMVGNRITESTGEDGTSDDLACEQRGAYVVATAPLPRSCRAADPR